MANAEGVADQGWFLDSGATHHLTNNAQNLSKGKFFSGSELLLVGNGQGLEITHTGCTCLYTSLGTFLILNNVLCVPKITKNLISISKLLLDNNAIIEFCSNMCFIKDKMERTLLAQGIAKGGLYQLLSQDNSLSYPAVQCSGPSSMLSFFSNKENVISLQKSSTQESTSPSSYSFSSQPVSLLASSKVSIKLLHA